MTNIEKIQEIVNKIQQNEHFLHSDEIESKLNDCEESGNKEIEIEDGELLFTYNVDFEIHKTSNYVSYNGNSICGGYSQYEEELEIESIELISVLDEEGEDISINIEPQLV